jgi:hypothetical protein
LESMSNPGLHAKKKDIAMINISSEAQRALAVMGIVTTLAACSNGGLQPSGLASSFANTPASHALKQSLALGYSAKDVSVSSAWNGNVHSDRRKSWISPDARSASRLYFGSDIGSNDVYIFSMPGMALKGTLTGFRQPQGLCSGAHGDIYVANTRAFQVLEYSRTGTLLNTYTDSYGYPVGCAYNPINGDLAVTNIKNVSGELPGNLLIYATPSSPPTILTNPGTAEYFFVGYDKSGHLWGDGFTYSASYSLFTCDASGCQTIFLSGGTIYYPGAVDWDGKSGNWVLFDQLCGGQNGFNACSYPVSASGVLGTPTYYRNYEGTAVCDMAQAVIIPGGKSVAGGDNEGSCPSPRASNTFDSFLYPSGGTTNYKTSPFSYSAPVGAAISTK